MCCVDGKWDGKYMCVKLMSRTRSDWSVVWNTPYQLAARSQCVAFDPALCCPRRHL